MKKQTVVSLRGYRSNPQNCKSLLLGLLHFVRNDTRVYYYFSSQLELKNETNNQVEIHIKFKGLKGIIGGFVFLLVAMSFGCEEKVSEGSRTAILPYYSEGTYTPQWLYPGTEAVQNFHRIPSFKLTNQEGETFSEQNLEGKIYVADFFFTSCPGICPKMTANMSVLQEEYLADEEVLLISHSVTPEIDTVEVLKRYAEEKGVNSKTWHLLTGDRSLIYNLGRSQYFVEEDLGLEKDPDDFLHTENFVLVDKDRHIRGIYNGLNKTAIKQLITDIETLKKEG